MPAARRSRTARIGRPIGQVDPSDNDDRACSASRSRSGAVGQAELVEVPHVTRSPTVAGSAFGHRDYAVCDLGRDAARVLAGRPGYGAGVIECLRSELQGHPRAPSAFSWTHVRDTGTVDLPRAEVPGLNGDPGWFRGVASRLALGELRGGVGLVRLIATPGRPRMPRMRRVARPVRSMPVAAHEWEPRWARVFIGTVA